MFSVGGVCPGCKRALADHLPSSRMMPAEVPAGKVAVVNGRCVVDGERAAQKCWWVQLREPMTLEEYRGRFVAKTIALEPCPGCGGRLTGWGSFPRDVVDGDSLLGKIRLVRGLCPDTACPVCTVTHDPVFLTPYVAASNRCVPAGGGPAAQNYPLTRVANRTPGLGDHPGESSEGKVSAARKGGTHQGGERVTGSQHEANAAAS